MSKIAKALEQAKRMRDGGGAPAPAAPAPAPAPAAAAPESEGSRRTADLGPPPPTVDRRRLRPQGAADRRNTDIGPPAGMLDRRDAGYFVPGVSPEQLAAGTCRILSFAPNRADHLERHKIMTFCHDQRAMDAYNFIRTHILDRTRKKKLNTLMITSVNPGEGKTLTAINLALSISREAKQTALLVEANLRRPAVARRLGLLSPCPGLADYLFHDLEVRDLILNPGLGSMLRVILGGDASTGSTDMISVPKMQHLVNELKSRYADRYIIFDCPHLKDMPDALIFSSYVDGIILVVESRRTSRYDLAQVLDHLKNKNIVGIVMNRGPLS